MVFSWHYTIIIVLFWVMPNNPILLMLEKKDIKI